MVVFCSPKPPEISRWDDPATMDTVLQLRGLGETREVHLGYDITREALDQQVFNQMQAWNAEMERAMLVPGGMLGGTTNAAAQQPDTLTMETLRQSVEQLRRQRARYLPLVGLRGIDPDVRDVLFREGVVAEWDHYNDQWRVAALPRLDVETAARSKERARGLLKSLLTSEQWAEFEAAGAITERIDGCEFRLTPGGMIEAMKPRLVGRAVSERWCISPDPYADKNDYMPDEDKLIGQLLHLRAGPDQVRRQANVFPVYR